MTDINTREAVFRTAIDAASVAFANGKSSAADCIRDAALSEAFLSALRDDPAPALTQLAAIIESTNTPDS